MSWSINVVGPRSAVKAKVQADQYIPPGLKQTIAEICDDKTASSANGIRVEGSGHSGGGTGYINSLKVEPITILAEETRGFAPVAEPPTHPYPTPGRAPARATGA